MSSTPITTGSQKVSTGYFEMVKETLRAVIADMDSCRTVADAKGLEQKWRYLKIAFEKSGYSLAFFASQVIEAEPKDSLVVSKLKEIGGPYLQKNGRFSTDIVNASGFQAAFEKALYRAILKSMYIEIYKSINAEGNKERSRYALDLVRRENLGMTFLHNAKEEARGHIRGAAKIHIRSSIPGGPNLLNRIWGFVVG